jgi:hypothetical protein
LQLGVSVPKPSSKRVVCEKVNEMLSKCRRLECALSGWEARSDECLVKRIGEIRMLFGFPQQIGQRIGLTEELEKELNRQFEHVAAGNSGWTTPVLAKVH